MLKSIGLGTAQAAWNGRLFCLSYEAAGETLFGPPPLEGLLAALQILEAGLQAVLPAPDRV